MPKDRKVRTVDGYAALKAAQRAVHGHDKHEAHQTSPASSPAARAQADLQKLGAHVGRTVMPAKHVIECYDCGYKFQLHGRASNTNCSKCRAVLDLTDHTINGKWAGTLKTAGSIVLAADGIVQWGELVANDVVLQGTIEAGSVRAMHSIELGDRATFPEQSLTAPNLKIRPGATITFRHEAKFQDVEVLGSLKARLHASGSIIVRAGALLEGKVFAEHLVVEDGGGLKAAVRVMPGAIARGIAAAA